MSREDTLDRVDPAWRWPASIAQLREQYKAAEPFPHLIVDNLFAPGVLDSLYADIPPPSDRAWLRWAGSYQEDCSFENLKRTISDLAQLPSSVAEVFQQLTSAAFLSDLRSLTSVPSLEVDLTLNGGGLQCSGRGAALRIHADPIRHPSPADFDQAINLILYINPSWTEEYGGDLELWTRDGKNRAVSVPPMFNRMVIFQADRSSYHGHPRANQCPEGQYRSSLALYYYVRRPKTIELESNRPIWR